MKNVFFDIETLGLNAWYGDKVTCICAQTEDDEVFQGVMKHKGNEYELINDFFKWLINLNYDYNIQLVSKNGKMFDIPFLCARMTLSSEYVEQTIINEVLNMPHFDLQEITYKRISLDDMAKMYGIKGKSGHGLQAIKDWKNKAYNKLRSYCANDVRVTKEVYEKYTENK